MGLQATLLRSPARLAARASTHPVVERALLTAGLVLLWTAGYHGIGRWVDPARAASLETPLDLAIPFVPESVYLYGLVYVVALLPAFVVRDRLLFRSVCAAYAAVIGTSLLAFALFPVSVVGFRPEPAQAAALLEPVSLTSWLVHTVYVLDPPTNGFPSLHVGLALVSAIGVSRAIPALWVGGVAVVAATIASTVLLKQHFVADSLGALAVVAICYALTLRRHVSAEGAPLACTWHGGAAFLALVGAAVGLVLAAYMRGLRA